MNLRNLENSINQKEKRKELHEKFIDIKNGIFDTNMPTHPIQIIQADFKVVIMRRIQEYIHTQCHTHNNDDIILNILNYMELLNRHDYISTYNVYIMDNIIFVNWTFPRDIEQYNITHSIRL